jgi:hypothetical protein
MMLLLRHVVQLVLILERDGLCLSMPYTRTAFSGH